MHPSFISLTLVWLHHTRPNILQLVQFPHIHMHAHACTPTHTQTQMQVYAYVHTPTETRILPWGSALFCSACLGNGIHSPSKPATPLVPESRTVPSQTERYCRPGHTVVVIDLFAWRECVTCNINIHLELDNQGVVMFCCCV